MIDRDTSSGQPIVEQSKPPSSEAARIQAIVDVFRQVDNSVQKAEFIDKAINSGNIGALVALLEVATNPVHISKMVDKIVESGTADQLQQARDVLKGKVPNGTRGDGGGRQRASLGLQIGKIDDKIGDLLFSAK